MAIFEIGLEDLQQGVLAAAFLHGAVAAVIRCDGRLRALWRRLLENPAERLPWEAPLIDIARNHHGSKDITVSLGDVYYFQPGLHGYIARKLEIDRPPGAGPAALHPARFHQGDDTYAPPADLIDECCSITDRIALAMTPERAEAPAYKVAVQRLKYQSSSDDLGLLAELTAHSLGRWGRFGYAIDCQRQRFAGMSARKGPADLYGLLMMVPLARSVAQAANALAGRIDDRYRIDDDQRVIEGPHVDSRLFTGLCGRRANIHTQVYAGDRWEELPVGLDSIAVFPGRLAERRYGLPATLHRVLQQGGDTAPKPDDPRTSNVTLLLGAT